MGSPPASAAREQLMSSLRAIVSLVGFSWEVGMVIVHTSQDGYKIHAARRRLVPNKGYCFVLSYVAVVPVA